MFTCGITSIGVRNLSQTLMQRFCTSRNRPMRFNGIKQTVVPMRVMHSGRQDNPPVQQRSMLKLTLLGTAIGAAIGTAYSMYNYSMETDILWQQKQLQQHSTPPVELNSLPTNVRITKRYVNPRDKSDLDIILFQFQTCPFCCKVRAYLDFMGISYSVVEVDAVLRQDIKWSKQKKVPMVLIRQDDGTYIQMNDSSAIISLLATYFNDKDVTIQDLAKFYPTVTYFDDNNNKKEDILNKYFLMFQNHTPKGHTKDIEEIERKWRIWTDQHLVHLISPNCYRTLTESFETFEWFSLAGEWDVYFPKWERNLMVYVGAIAMWMISKILKKRHNLTDDVRYDIYNALDDWTSELRKQQTKFLGGKQPNLADLAVFGVLSSMEGCQAFKDCMQNTNIQEWFYSVKDLILQNRGYLIRERMENPVPALWTTS